MTVQFPFVAVESHKHIRRSISVDRFRISVTAPPRLAKELVLSYVYPAALKSISVTDTCGIDMYYMVSVLF